MTRRTLLVGALLLAGCQSTVGPFAPKPPGRVDNPCLTIEEQQSRGRERYALPDERKEVGPHSGVQLPGPHDR